MIDLRSDTLTGPSEQMRTAARDAEVGDDKRDGDPTVGELEARTADLLGMERALFLPSGTMGNQVAACAHTEPGQEVLVDRKAHVITSERSGLARLSGLQIRMIEPTRRGVIRPEDVQAGVEECRYSWPGVGLLLLENTHNKRGGTVITPDEIDGAAEAAHDHDVRVHLDGARLVNAAVARDCDISRFTASIDSVMFDLSKGLGAPIGAVLAGSETFVDHAEELRNLFGGGLRQASVVAGPGLVALSNVDRLAEDHRNAERLASELAELDPLDVQPPETNIVLVDVSATGLAAEEFVRKCEAEGVRADLIDDRVVRFCTYSDVDRDDVTRAASAVRRSLDAT